LAGRPKLSSIHVPPLRGLAGRPNCFLYTSHPYGVWPVVPIVFYTHPTPTGLAGRPNCFLYTSHPYGVWPVVPIVFYTHPTPTGFGRSSQLSSIHIPPLRGSPGCVNRCFIETSLLLSKRPAPPEESTTVHRGISIFSQFLRGWYSQVLIDEQKFHSQSLCTAWWYFGSRF
jgi:hypothetical protein